MNWRSLEWCRWFFYHPVEKDEAGGNMKGCGINCWKITPSRQISYKISHEWDCRSALKRVIQNSRSKQPIFVELVVAIGLRWLAGGSYQEIEDVFGVRTNEAYRSRNKFIDALLNWDQVEIRLPTTVIEWEEVWKGFESKSSGSIISGCVGARDGFFQRPLTPNEKDCDNNQTAYLLGHYEHFGVSCLGICDVKGWYLIFYVASPGKTNDTQSFVNAGCHKILRDMSASTYFVGDAAFDLSENFITPFKG